MKPTLHPPDLHYLQAAQGWLELGNVVEAEMELRQIAQEFSALPEVLETRWQVSARQLRWQECVEIGQQLVEALPDHPLAWLHRSFALHELRRTLEAFDLLRQAADRFHDNWTVAYNLACYCAQLGRLEECKKWFSKAMEIDADRAKTLGKDDPDLAPLRAEEGW